jgi:hypothetical protein
MKTKLFSSLRSPMVRWLALALLLTTLLATLGVSTLRTLTTHAATIKLCSDYGGTGARDCARNDNPDVHINSVQYVVSKYFPNSLSPVDSPPFCQTITLSNANPSTSFYTISTSESLTITPATDTDCANKIASQTITVGPPVSGQTECTAFFYYVGLESPYGYCGA